MKSAGTFLEQLSGLRATVRRRLIAYGVCAVGAGGVVALLTIVTLDWTLRLPAPLRIVVTGFFAIGFLLACYHWIIRPIRAEVPLTELAARLERFFPGLKDRLSSAVQFMQDPSAGSGAMIQRAIDDAREVSRNTPLAAALTLQPLAIQSTVMALAGLALAAITFTMPHWIQTGVVRYVYPFGPTEWPRRVQIAPLTGDEIVAVGESVVLRMRVDRGLSDTLRGLVRLKQNDGATLVQTMQREPDDTFRATLDVVTSDLAYWFEAGDDSTERRSGKVHVIRRPEVVDAIAAIEPPEYSGRNWLRIESLQEGPVRAPRRGFVHVTIQTSKPIPVNPADVVDPANRTAGLVLEDGAETFVPLFAHEDSPQAFFTKLEIEGDLRFRVFLRDSEGFANHGAATYTITAVPDSAPSVAIVEPRAEAEITPRGSLDVTIRVEDDFGITAARIETTRPDGTGLSAIPISNSLTPTPGIDRWEAEGTVRWKAESLRLIPGDMVLLTSSAVDNDTTGETAGKSTTSAPIRVRIISELEFEVRVRDEMAMVEERIRHVLLDQTENLDRTKNLASNGDTRELADVERDVAANLSSQESRLIRRVVDVNHRLTELLRHMGRNVAGADDGRTRIAALSNNLQKIAAGTMTIAANELNQVSKSSDHGDPQTALREAIQQQEITVLELTAMLGTMSQWGTVKGLVTRTRDLLDRQTNVSAQTAKVGQSTLGKALDALKPDEASDLRKNQRQQDQLATDVEQLLARMRQVESSSEEKDAAAGEAVESALRTAGAHDLQKRLRDATEAIASNRTSTAIVDQKAAAAALRAMASALDKREQRELESLRKELRRSEEQVADLLHTQQTLQKSAREADRTENRENALSDLAQQQHALRLNAKVVGEELSKLERAASAARLVRDSAAPMLIAEDHLRQLQIDTATSAQGEAIGHLQEALSRLEEIAAAAEQESWMKSLTEIGEDLQALIDGQRAINSGIESLVINLSSDGQLSRPAIREAAQLAKQQKELHGSLNLLMPDVAKVAVYEWALKRVERWMESIRGELEQRIVSAELSSVGGRIVRELEQLVQAINATRERPENPFAERDSGEVGEGGQAAGNSTAVPPLAELFVLRAMQADIHDRTRKLHESVHVETASEAELKELAILGEDQRELRRLTEVAMQLPGRP